MPFFKRNNEPETLEDDEHVLKREERMNRITDEIHDRNGYEKKPARETAENQDSVTVRLSLKELYADHAAHSMVLEQVSAALVRVGYPQPIVQVELNRLAGTHIKRIKDIEEILREHEEALRLSH